MDQLERDLTYGLDGVRATCIQYGWKSSECQNSIEIWQNQHNWNIKFEKYNDYLGVGFIIIVLIITLPFLVGHVLKHQAYKKKEEVKKS